MGLLQNLILRIKGDPSNAIQAFNKTEEAGKRMARTLRQEVTNPLAGAFDHVVQNAKGFVLSLIAVEKTLETIKRLFDRGRSTRDIANRFRISNDQAALINRAANVTGESADEIATKLGLEEKKLSNAEVRTIVGAIARQNPFTVQAEKELAEGTFRTEVAGRRALEAASHTALEPLPTAATSRFNPLVQNVAFRTRSSTTPQQVSGTARGLIRDSLNQDILRELQEIKRNTEESARADKATITF